MTPTTNHELLQEYIDGLNTADYVDVYSLLISIQSRLIEPMEYEIGKSYHFSNDGEEWYTEKFTGYGSDYNDDYRYIRHIKVPNEITSAISLLEKEGYTITKVVFG